MLDAALETQLKSALTHLQRPLDLLAAVDDGAASAELMALLGRLAECSPMLRIVQRDDGERVPSFGIAPRGERAPVRFAGVPLGHEFTSLVLALLHVGGHPPRLTPACVDQVRALDADLHFEIYMSLSCHNCPEVVQALNTMAALNPRITAVAIDGALFQDEVQARKVMAVPSVFLNGQPWGQGRMSIEQIVARLDRGAARRAAAALEGRAPYDVLVVGGGPAGAAAALYAARKGLRTGVVADRFGGQTLDTLGIDNFVSVPHTEGPTFAAALEAHVRGHDVDIIVAQRAVRVVRDALLAVHLDSGAVLQSRSVVVATGARWRELGVPGERQYRGKGVAYCPHCDGPLFQGKRVAVVGGGNSGVEAAIDLAALAAEVTLLEFAPELRADAVLVARLRSLSNVRVVTRAATTAVEGDGSQVTGLAYTDRDSGGARHIALDGVFVQIGLVPNTDWLKGTVALNRQGEIEIDARGQTSLPGVFAAGDATTVPFKQIIIAAGEGAKAALGAFEHLIRTPVPAIASPA